VNFSFPFSESILIYIGLATIFVGIIMIATLFYQVLNRPHRKNKKEEEKKPSGVLKQIGKIFTLIQKAFRGPSINKDDEKIPPGCLNQLAKVLFILLMIALGLAIMFFGAFVQSLTAFTKEDLVAEVYSKEIDVKNNSMKIVLIEKKGRNANVPQEFWLTGDRWFVRGDIIRWENWVNFLGLNTMYKLTRVGGYFTDTRKEAELKSSQYSLVPEEETPRWRWLYKNGYELPLIKAVYGNSVSQYPELRKVFKIYVTPNGFSLGTEDKEVNQ
jgi:uncharacterized membrane protein